MMIAAGLAFLFIQLVVFVLVMASYYGSKRSDVIGN